MTHHSTDTIPCDGKVSAEYLAGLMDLFGEFDTDHDGVVQVWLLN